jgi:hypothetical protein
LANKNAYLDIYLDEEGSLSKDIFNFTDIKGNKVNYDLTFYTEDRVNEK